MLLKTTKKMRRHSTGEWPSPSEERACIPKFHSRDKKQKFCFLVRSRRCLCSFEDASEESCQVLKCTNMWLHHNHSSNRISCTSTKKGHQKLLKFWWGTVSLYLCKSSNADALKWKKIRYLLRLVALNFFLGLTKGTQKHDSSASRDIHSVKQLMLEYSLK